MVGIPRVVGCSMYREVYTHHGTLGSMYREVYPPWYPVGRHVHRKVYTHHGRHVHREVYTHHGRMRTMRRVYLSPKEGGGLCAECISHLREKEENSAQSVPLTLGERRRTLRRVYLSPKEKQG